MVVLIGNKAVMAYVNKWEHSFSVLCQFHSLQKESDGLSAQPVGPSGRDTVASSL